ncbi:hypothetical protein [Pseudomonas sp. A-B-19]|uniref:hypothetical protein n=1 Tax=Pseudomonas sp. A-B-19 TaxID=2832405 RepID=UPI001CBDD063|nr:hypothetical protein [Pseudomonas sp. A-B-19]
MKNNNIIDHLPLDLKKIHECKGMRFINDQRMRTFSLNILYMNATKLIEETVKLEDPDIGVSLMFEGNRDAGEQAHREINRHIHNFVTAAKTVVDHTRVLLEERYDKDNILKKISGRISETVGIHPVCKFVHDLRNYMVHKGLPNSEMYLHATNNGADEGMHFVTGVRIKTESLWNYSGWTGPAKKYINQSNEYIDIGDFTQEYVNETRTFNDWLDATLSEHHSMDLIELSQLQEASNQSNETNSKSVPLDKEDVLLPAPEQGEQKKTIKELVDSISIGVFSKLHIIENEKLQGSRFKSKRANILEIRDENILKEAVITNYNTKGQKTISFIHEKGKSHGLIETDLNILQDVIHHVTAEKWAKDKFDIEFVVQTFADWARTEFRNNEKTSFYEYLQHQALSNITTHQVFFPIANFEIEGEFEFGPLKITSLEPEFFESITNNLFAASEETSSQTQGLINKLKSNFQGLGAIELSIDAHESVVAKNAFALATDAVDLLRFFAPQAPMGSARCPMALSGAEYLPQKKILTLSANGLSMHEGLLPEFFGHWQLSDNEIIALREKGLLKAGALLDTSKLDDFSQSVKTGIIMFSKGCTMINLADRLHYTLSALEEIFLQHSVEAVESCIARRVSSLIPSNADERTQIHGFIQKSYGLRNQYKSIYSSSESNAINMCIFFAHAVISTALVNIGNFLTKKDFISAVERQFKEN